MALGTGQVNTGSFPRRLWPGVKLWYGDEYDRYAPEYVDIFDIESSDKDFELFTAIAGTGLGVTKNEGSPVTYASFRQALTTKFVNVEYALGFIITSQIQQDDQYATKLTEIGARFLAESMLQLKETIGANVLNNGFATDATHIGGDGLSLFNTAHTTVSGATYQNRPTADADLSEAAIEQAEIDIAGQVDEAGLKIKVVPMKLIIPRQLKFTASRILETPLRVGTADNDINAIKSMGVMSGGFVVNHYLTSSKAWFIKTNRKDGLKMIERSGFESSADNDFDTDNAKFKVKERYFQSWVDPRGAYGSSPA